MLCCTLTVAQLLIQHPYFFPLSSSSILHCQDKQTASLMAPSAVSVAPNGDSLTHTIPKSQNGRSFTDSKIKLPLEANGSLDDYHFKDLTPCLGREFPTANLVDMMNDPNSDELISELALTSTKAHSVSRDRQQPLH